MVTATFRFYVELNDFLTRDHREKEFTVPCARAATTKHMIEALGVPHTEVELVLVNGESAGFDRLIADGDRIAVYPQCEALDVTSLLHVRERPLRQTRFVADAHLGGLARQLRMAGFDTLYDNNFRDGEVEALSLQENRIVLTRDRELLKRRDVTHGCYVRAIRSPEQFREIVTRLDLSGSFRPFTLCVHCNAPLHAIAKPLVADRVPQTAYACHERFSTCDVCHRIYWEGTHWQRMQGLLDTARRPASPPSTADVP